MNEKVGFYFFQRFTRLANGLPKNFAKKSHLRNLLETNFRNCHKLSEGNNLSVNELTRGNQIHDLSICEIYSIVLDMWSLFSVLLYRMIWFPRILCGFLSKRQFVLISHQVVQVDNRHKIILR